MRRPGAVVAAVGVVLAVAACDDAVAGEPLPVETTEDDFAGQRVFDESALEGPDGVMKILVDDYKMENIAGVDCPDDQVVEQGTTFTCMVTQGGDEGGELSVEITVTSDEGEYQVALPEEK